MSGILRPAAEWELQSMVAASVSDGHSIEVVGHGALRQAGRPIGADVVLTTSSLRGVTLYEPMELVMSARSGTRLSDIEKELAARGQMLAFEPVDLGPTIGAPLGELSIGGVFATNVSGARRIAQGSARDHLLGIRAVNGRAELFKSGGRVMKNVTGLDLGRGLTASWGTLAVLTEVTFKVVPRPEATATLVFADLPDDLAIEALTTAMGTPYEVSGAMHLQASAVARLGNRSLRDMGEALTLVRVENFTESVPERVGHLRSALKIYGEPTVLETSDSIALWSELSALSVFPYSNASVLWRISTRPTAGAAIVEALSRSFDITAVYDWSGGLVWLEMPLAADAGAADIRRAVAVRGGHTTLIRAPEQVRASVDVFEPMRPEVERLAVGVKNAFDPGRILNRGRMYAGF